MTVNDLAAWLEVAPTTGSLLVGELSRRGILERHEDASDRRRRIVSISGGSKQSSIANWLAPGAAVRHQAPGPLTSDQRRMFIDTSRAYEAR